MMSDVDTALSCARGRRHNILRRDESHGDNGAAEASIWIIRSMDTDFPLSGVYFRTMEHKILALTIPAKIRSNDAGEIRRI